MLLTLKFKKVKVKNRSIFTYVFTEKIVYESSVSKIIYASKHFSVFHIHVFMYHLVCYFCKKNSCTSNITWLLNHMLSAFLFSLLPLPVNITNSTFHSNKSVNDYTDLAHSIRFSMYYSEGDFMSKLNIKSCTIMSLNCQSLHGKFIQHTYWLTH